MLFQVSHKDLYLHPFSLIISLMTFFNFIETADAHNFADDNKLKGESHIDFRTECVIMT